MGMIGLGTIWLRAFEGFEDEEELVVSDVSAQLAGKMAPKQLHGNFHQ